MALGPRTFASGAPLAPTDAIGGVAAGAVVLALSVPSLGLAVAAWLGVATAVG